MTAQWDLIQRTVVSSASTVTFSSIGSYQAYRVIASSLDAASSDYLAVRLNGSTSSMYSIGYFSNSASGNVIANGFNSYMALGINARNSSPGTSSSIACNIIDIGFANNTSRPKPLIGLGGYSRNMLRASGASWNNTSALTSIALGVGSPFGTFATNTVITLYGRNIA